VGEQGGILDEVESCLTEVRYVVEVDRVLATVMTVRLAASDEERQAWRERADSYVRRQVELFKGRVLGYGPEGLQAAFDGPARAIRCGSLLNQTAQQRGLALQVGIHTGECEMAGATMRGVALDISAEVAALAPPGEVLVSRTVTDLVAGSGLSFHEYGRPALPRNLGEWRLFTVTA
jgi:class 3 adenylate cyclase